METTTTEQQDPYTPAFIEEFKYPDGTITSTMAIQKFQTFIEQILIGKLSAQSIESWNWYLTKYLIPFKASCSRIFIDILLDTIVAPKTRLILLGDLIYFFDYLLQPKDSEYVELYMKYSATRVQAVVQWVYYRVLYQQLLADYASSQGVDVDISKLSEQLVKFDKVIQRWNNPKPSKSTPHIHPPPVFPISTLHAIDSTRAELLFQYNSRLHNQQNRLLQFSQHHHQPQQPYTDDLQQQYQSTNQYQYNNNQQFDANANESNSGQYQVEQWSYGDYTDDLIEALHEEILGTKLSKKASKNKKQKEKDSTQDKILHIQRFPVQPPPCYQTDQFRLFQPSVYQILSQPPNSRTCTTCGMVFLETDLKLYEEHIRYHIRRTQFKKHTREGLDKRSHENLPRQLFYDVSDWIHFRHSSDHLVDSAAVKKARSQLDQWHKQFGQNVDGQLNTTNSQMNSLDQDREMSDHIFLHGANLDNITTDNGNDDDDRSDDDTKLSLFDNNDELYQDDGTINETRLPFYDPRDGFSSLNQTKYSKPDNYKTNSTNRCAICSDEFDKSYHNSKRDSWVIPNCIYVTQELILQYCIVHIVSLKKSRYKRAIESNEISKLGLLQIKDGEKNQKFSFTEPQRIELAKRLEMFVGTKAQGCKQQLVHYHPCFCSILKDSTKYDY